MNKATWENAESDCYNKGGHLASIHSLAEHIFISQLVDPGAYTPFWLGASDTDLEVIKLLLLHMTMDRHISVNTI
jgi:hypothetical protein